MSMSKTQYPELQPGIRVQYTDRDSKTRAGRIVARRGSMITIETPLKEHHRIEIEKVLGYWQPHVKASPKNRINLII